MKDAAAEVCERLCRVGEPGVVAPKLLVVLAHADDEVLALGGRMEWLGASRFATATDGVPLDGRDAREHGFGSLEEYGAARRRELDAAMMHAGLDVGCAVELRLEDGTLVPDQRAALFLVGLSRAVAKLVEQLRPEAVLTHPYEGGHPDHDACAFVVNAAVRCAGLDAVVIEAPFYHADAGGAGMRTGEFLGGVTGCEAVLTESQTRKKRERLGCFLSQGETLGQFGVERERYRAAPAYDFTRRPHAGRLHYERYDWGMDGDRFCGLAGDALRELSC